MQEIEICPDCYRNSHTQKDTWFVLACRIPHLLVWAKLKGFPFWPGKAMRSNSYHSVDVRFFGAHEQAWIPTKDVFLYSLEPPVAVKVMQICKTKIQSLSQWRKAGWNGIGILFTCHYLQSKSQKGSLEGIFHEVNLHIKYIKKSFFKFKYAPFKTPFEPRREMEHIKTMYPRFSLPFQLRYLDDSLWRGRRAYSFSESEADISTGKSNQAELKDNVSEWIDNSPTRLTKEFQVPSNTPYIPGKKIRAQHMIPKH